MSGDEPLREAADPTTPGERLADLFRRSLGGGSVDEDLALAQAVLRNPNVPMAVLREGVLGSGRWETAPRRQLEAWRNPSVPLLMLTMPDPRYGVAARRLLVWLENEHASGKSGNVAQRWEGASLDRVVAFWARMRPGPSLAIVRAFARHLAGLFGLPWPSEAA